MPRANWQSLNFPDLQLDETCLFYMELPRAEVDRRSVGRVARVCRSRLAHLHQLRAESPALPVFDEEPLMERFLAWVTELGWAEDDF